MSQRPPGFSAAVRNAQIGSALPSTPGGQGDPDYFRRFPVFVIGFALSWIGVLWPLDQLWAQTSIAQNGLIQPLMALLFVLLGLAITTARSHVPAARGMALAAGLIGMAAPWLQSVQAENQVFAHEMGVLWPCVFALLSIALAGATMTPTHRYFARVLCALSAGMVLAYFGVAAIERGSQLPMFSADMLYGALAWLGAAAIASISRRCTPESAYDQKAPFMAAVFGTLLAAVSWYVVSEEGRYTVYHAARVVTLSTQDDLLWSQQWDGTLLVQPLLSRLLPALLFLGGLVFSVLMSRSLKLSSVLAEHARQMEYSTLHDPLTGLPNKKLLGKELSRLLAELKGEYCVVWVVALDLRGLKLINDSVGHTIGDKVLREAAKRIQSSADLARLIARLEGDEFILAFTGVAEKQVALSVQKVMAQLGLPYTIDGLELRLAAAAGITGGGSAVNDPMQLVREAELAMAWAEREGNNTLHVYSPELSVPAQERLTLRTELQHALEHEQFQLYYQPILDARSGNIVGAEALLRWPHSSRGLISPRYFIGLAEETGLIVPLSNWVVDTACRDISRLRDRNHADFPVVVNVSPLHFRRSDFVDVLKRAIDRHGLPEGALDLEITESMVIEHTDDTFDKLDRVRELGVRVSIDDFGTGYSSLNYLKRLPIDKIKIDQSFVRDVISDRRDAAIVKSIIGLAHHLNLRVVAEGVESEPQFWFLKRNFCDEVQGYLFQRPVPFDDFSQLLFEQGGRIPLPMPRIPAESDKVLLLLDDEPNILRALSRLLRRDGYRILTASTPQQAFNLLAENDVQVVMSDQRMPDMTGTEFFSRVKEMYPETVRLILSGYTDLKSVTDAINHGAIYRFLTKPWDDAELRREIAEAFKVYQS